MVALAILCNTGGMAKCVVASASAARSRGVGCIGWWLGFYDVCWLGCFRWLGVAGLCFV